MNTNEENIKPTFTKPITPMGENFDKKFNSTMDSQGINLNEIDKKLNEANFKLKKKIFNLAKMEALTFSDPNLTAIYDEMQVSGNDRFGYHANETILNIMFNDYVLNSAKYLQKYKMAIPKKKKRRDKSGIDALKKNAEKQLAKTRDKKINVDEGSWGDAWNKSWDDILNAPLVDDEEDTNDPNYMGQRVDKPMANPSSLDKGLEKIGTTYNNAVNRFKQILPKKHVDETTSAGSAGGDAGYVGYAGPAAWSAGGDLIKGTKSTDSDKNVGGKSTAGIMRKPMWPGGTVIQENNENYLVNPIGFIKYVENMINEDANQSKRTKLDDKLINDTNAFTSYTVKHWDKSDAGLEDETVDTGVLDSSSIENKINEKLTDLPKKIEEDTDQSMIGDNPTSITNDTTQTMANTLDNPEKAISGIERGSTDSSTITENTLFEKIERELNAYSTHQNNLKKMTEERKTNSQIINDRVTAQNPTNFKSAMSNSGTLSTINLNKSLQTKDDIEEVGNNPHKFSEELEKTEISKTNGEALKNVGDSGNEKGNEIPKKNLTNEEQHEVDMYREGLGDYVYDLPPSKQFEERMKTDMGDKLYKDRQDKLEIRASRNLYNKTEQPVTNKKEVNPKYAGNIAESANILDSLITGRYKDSLGKSHIIDFNFNEVSLTESVDENWSQIHFDGMGNSYANKLNQDSAKLEINESIVNLLDSKKYYITENKQIFAIENKKTIINESEKKEIIQESDEVKRMKKLLGYKTNTYVNNKFNKRF